MYMSYIVTLPPLTHACMCCWGTGNIKCHMFSVLELATFGLFTFSWVIGCLIDFQVSSQDYLHWNQLLLYCCLQLCFRFNLHHARKTHSTVIGFSLKVIRWSSFSTVLSYQKQFHMVIVTIETNLVKFNIYTHLHCISLHRLPTGRSLCFLGRSLIVNAFNLCMVLKSSSTWRQPTIKFCALAFSK